MNNTSHPSVVSNGSPLRIGLMLRGIHEVDGPGVYIRAICDALFRLDSHHAFFAYYDSDSEVGRYGHFSNVRERVLSSSFKLLWDQVLVPYAAWKDDLDVLFHHKFTIPVVSPCPTIVEQQGAEYWTHPQWYGRLERWHAKVGIPTYCGSADKVLAISRSLARQLSPHIGIPEPEIDHIHAAADNRFRPIDDASRIRTVRDKYSLPQEQFFLMVAKGYSSATIAGEEFYPRKNVGGVLTAYAELSDRVEKSALPPLVVVGPGFDHVSVAQYLAEHDRIDEEKISFPGLVDFEEMPVLYSLARALLFPSYSESFGIPLVEAMACGCPVIASDTTSCPEVVRDAGLLVDPNSSSEIAKAMLRLIRTPELGKDLSERGRRRAKAFSWEASARKLLAIFEDVADVDDGRSRRASDD